MTDDIWGIPTPPDEIADARNVLVLSDHAHESGDCGALLRAHTEAGSSIVLVSFIMTADERLDALEGLDVPADTASVICMGDASQPEAAQSTTASAADGEVTVTSISDPTDLFRLGLSVSEALEAPEGPAVLCVHTLSALLNFVELPRAFRFLHVLTGRVKSLGGRAHYHLDPERVDDQVVDTVRQLFDVVVRFEDGVWVVD